MNKDKYTEEDLINASAEMMLRSIDFDDNNCSSERMEFWREFERVRDRYRLIKKAVKGSS